MNRFSIFVMALLATVSGPVWAGLIVNTLGNDTAFTDGQLITAVDLSNAQSGQPSPFDPGNSGNGNDLLSNFDQTWIHSYGAITDPILSAMITFGIYDSEGGSVGTATDGSGDEVTLTDEQLNVFEIEGISHSTRLIGAGFEDGGQGQNGQYEVYSVDLLPATFAGLLDGSADVRLALQGPVFSPAVLVFLDDIVNDFNGAALVYSTLTIETDSSPPTPVPEPPVLALLLIGFASLVLRGRFRRPV